MPRTIDIHAHLAPHVLRAARAEGRDLHGIDPNVIARGQLLDISPDRRLADMDRLGVDVQVVSAEPQAYCYQYPAAAALALHRASNDEVGDLRDAAPGRFAGLAIVPLQDIPLAIGELERTMARPGFRGVMIGDHVNGAMFDEPQFEPFWSAAEEANALVFVHQASPTLVQARMPRYHLSNTVGNAVERTLSFGALVFGGVLDRHPDLRFVLAHGGGYACMAAARMDWGWQWREEARVHIAAPPTSYLPRFWYDCITHSESVLRFVIDTVGIDRVVFGTDYPGFAAGKSGAHYQPREWLEGLGALSRDEKDAILGGNLEALLGLEPAPA